MTTVLLAIALCVTLVGALARVQGIRQMTWLGRAPRLLEVLRHDVTRLWCAATMIVLLLLFLGSAETPAETALFVGCYLLIAAITAMPSGRELEAQDAQVVDAPAPTVIRLGPYEVDHDVLVGAGAQN